MFCKIYKIFSRFRALFIKGFHIFFFSPCFFWLYIFSSTIFAKKINDLSKSKIISFHIFLSCNLYKLYKNDRKITESSSNYQAIKVQASLANQTSLKPYVARLGIKFGVEISLTLTTSGRVRDFHPTDIEHAEHTKGSVIQSLCQPENPD